MKKIEELRKELNMSLKEFSKYYEIPYNTVRQWEKGERTPPNYIIKLLNELINLKTKGEQLKIRTNDIEYYCYSIDKTGKTGVYHGLYQDSVENWKKAVTKKNKRAWIEVHEIIERINVN